MVAQTKQPEAPVTEDERMIDAIIGLCQGVTCMTLMLKPKAAAAMIQKLVAVCVAVRDKDERRKGE